MAVADPSSFSPAEPLPLAAAFFDPCAERARLLDARMRARLADSVRYLAAQLDGHLAVPEAALDVFLTRLAEGPVCPHAFAAYADLVLAIDAGALGEAALHLGDLLAAPAAPSGPRILALGDARDRGADRIRRHVDTDPEQPLEILPPPPELAASARARIEAALARLDAGNAELADEIRVLVREIVLAVGSTAPGAWTFDGASSFMLWGAVVLNAAGQASVLETAQALAHESAHNLLFGLCADGALLRNDDSERFASPLRVDARPLDGIFHATFVTARMHQAVARLIASGTLDAVERAEAERALGENRRLFAQGLATLDAHAKLTPLGETVLGGAREYMQRAPW